MLSWQDSILPPCNILYIYKRINLSSNFRGNLLLAKESNGQFSTTATTTKGLATRRDVYPRERVTLALTQFLFFLRRVYKAARVTRVGGLSYLRAWVTLAGGLTFSLV